MADLFAANGLSRVVLENYFFYHIESPDLMVADFDAYLATGKRPLIR